MKTLICLFTSLLLLTGCATGEATRPADPAQPVVKSTPPKPVLTPETLPAPPVKPTPAPSAVATGADVITLPASPGPVTFPHRKHQDILKGCGSCHGGQPGRIAAMGKEWAHQTCRGCHTEMKTGPVGCSGCHKK